MTTAGSAPDGIADDAGRETGKPGSA